MRGILSRGSRKSQPPEEGDGGGRRRRIDLLWRLLPIAVSIAAMVAASAFLIRCGFYPAAPWIFPSRWCETGWADIVVGHIAVGASVGFGTLMIAEAVGMVLAHFFRKQDEQERRQIEQERRQREQEQRQIEQDRWQREQDRWQREQDRRQEEQDRRQEEQDRRQEEQDALIRSLIAQNNELIKNTREDMERMDENRREDMERMERIFLTILDRQSSNGNSGNGNSGGDAADA